jgi:putative oxygen-independent coproporphyrinogen III oxidase
MTQSAREGPLASRRVEPTLSLPPLSLYVHMPWCVRKCPYCDFNSHAAPAVMPKREYLDALIEDLAHDRELAQERQLISVFFGGGTPSLFSPDEIARFMEAVRTTLTLAPTAEVTLEANPGTVEHGSFAAYRAAGINRVSLGAQSFNERHLEVLGRIHAAGDIERAVDELVSGGIENFNLDLMYGLPEQTIEEALADLERAIALNPTHLSHYQLTLEPGTVFYHRPPTLPDDETAWDMQERCQERLAQAGYAQYEVSGYAREGRRCEHNLNYWRFGDYLGIGAGAHGKITHVSARRVERTARIKQPRTYLMRAPHERFEEHRQVNAEDLPFEFMLNALRLRDGFDERLFESRTGRSFASIEPILEQAAARGLMERGAPETWRPTALGRRFLNDLQGLFLGAPEAKGGTAIAHATS